MAKRKAQQQQAQDSAETGSETEIEAAQSLDAAEIMADNAADTDAAEAADGMADTDSATEATTAAPAEELAITQDDVRLVEAILFASSSSVSIGQIAERFPEDRVKLIPDVLELLQEQYANRGVNLVQRDNRYALRTSADLGDQMRLEKEQPKKFTRAAQETMAIIAYHQPVTRAEIENIRGVATSPGALDALMEAGWIKPGKRREVPGRPVTWLTTQAFLDHFGLEKLEDLPGMEELKAAGLLDKRPAIEAMPTADLFDGEGHPDANHDPQEVTDEDLIGKSDADEDDFDDEDLDRAPETAADREKDEDDADEDFDDEDGDDGDYADDEDDFDDESDDDDSDDDSDDGDDDSDDDDSDDGDDDFDDDEDDDDDDDFDDEDGDDDEKEKD